MGYNVHLFGREKGVTYLVQYTQYFGQYCGTFAGVDHIIVEYTSLLQDGTLLKAEERVAASCRKTKWRQWSS